MKKQTAKRLPILAAGILALPAITFAGTDANCCKECKTIEKIKESCISGDIGLDIVSQYISHGVVFENQGVILQPYVNLSFKVYEGEGFLNEVTVDVGNWNSFHDRHTDAGLVNGSGDSSTRSWYESDFIVGMSFTFAKNFTLSPAYTWYLSPNDAFTTAQSLNFKLEYDDTDLLGDFALHPWFNFWWEVENKFGSGVDEGFLYEIGIAPSHTWGNLTVTVPLTLGFGSSDFYSNADGGNETYGYFSAGVSLSYALTCVPECLGKWALKGSYTYYNLGDGLRDYGTALVGGDIRDSNENEHVFGGGLVVEF